MFWRTYCIKCGAHLKNSVWKQDMCYCPKCETKHIRYWVNDGVTMNRAYKVTDY